MKKLATVLVCSMAFLTAHAQQGFLGIQNSPRKGLVHANMNPAEINNLHKKVELNLFSVGASVANSSLTYQDMLNADGEDIMESSLRRNDDPLNLYLDVQVLGPGLAIQAKKWAFGVTTRATVFGNVNNLNNTLGKAVFDLDNYGASQRLSNTGSQHYSIAGWSDIGLTVGREIINTESHKLSMGGAIRWVMPMAYSHIGIKDLQGTVGADANGSYLTDARGELILEYVENQQSDWGDMLANSFALSNIQGRAFDFGVSHILKRNGRPFISSGLSVRNLGQLPLGAGFRQTHYQVDIPADQSVYVDIFTGNQGDIEEDLNSSPYFQQSSKEVATVRLPGVLNVYTDFYLTKILNVSLMMQQNLIIGPVHGQRVVAVTPRLNLGFLELYSPWINSEIGGTSGGLGLRLGSLYVGSQSILSAAFSDTRQLDAHVGWSWGFGRRNKAKKETESI